MDTALRLGTRKNGSFSGSQCGTIQSLICCSRSLLLAVGSLLLLSALLVSLSHVNVWLLLSVAHLLPGGTEDSANLSKGSVGVVVLCLLSLVLGEEHVGGQSSLGGVGVLRSRRMSCNVVSIVASLHINVDKRTLTFPFFLGAGGAAAFLGAIFGYLECLVRRVVA